MDGDLASLDFIDRIDSTGSGLPVRLVCALEHRPGLAADEARSYLLSRDRLGRRWRGGLVKLFLDGVIDTGTGWLYEPDTLGEGLKSFWPDPADYAAAWLTQRFRVPAALAATIATLAGLGGRPS